MASIVEDTKKEEEASDSEDSEDYVHPLFRENLDSVGPPGPPAFYIAAPLQCRRRAAITCLPALRARFQQS